MSNLYVELEGIEIANAHETIRPGGIFERHKPGTMVAVRPCDAQYGNRTYLGMYLCDAPTNVIGKQVGKKIRALKQLAEADVQVDGAGDDGAGDDGAG